MKKTIKKSTGITIGFVALFVLLLFSLILNITGAWFTAKTNQTGNTVTLTFGNVAVTLSCGTYVYNMSTPGSTIGEGTYPTHGAQSTAVNPSGTNYLLEAGTKVSTGITITNTSTIDIYYILKGADNNYYVIDNSNNNNKLVQVTNNDAGTTTLTNKGVLTNGADISITSTFTVKATANNGTSGKDNVWTISGCTTGANDITTEVEFGQPVNLGVYLFSQQFSLRAMQKDNITAANARTYLMTDDNW